MGAFGIPLRAYDKFAAAAEFRGRAWNWVDPQKEMTAAITGLQAGILSLSDVAANYGKDSEELLSQIARDRALMEQFNISYGLEPYGVQKMPEVAEEGDEEDSRSEDELNRALVRALGGDFGQ
jgi:capsid protein